MQNTAPRARRKRRPKTAEECEALAALHRRAHPKLARTWWEAAHLRRRRPFARLRATERNARATR